MSSISVMHTKIRRSALLRHIHTHSTVLYCTYHCADRSVTTRPYQPHTWHVIYNIYSLSQENILSKLSQNSTRTQPSSSSLICATVPPVAPARVYSTSALALAISQVYSTTSSATRNKLKHKRKHNKREETVGRAP